MLVHRALESHSFSASRLHSLTSGFKNNDEDNNNNGDNYDNYNDNDDDDDDDDNDVLNQICN